MLLPWATVIDCMSFMYVYSEWLRNINGVSLIMLIMLEIDYNNENTVKSKDKQ